MAFVKCYNVAQGRRDTVHHMTIRGLVVSKYGSMTKFAEHIGWSGRKTRDIITGRQQATAKDIEQMAMTLGINEANEFVSFFYPSMPQSSAN